MERGVGGIWLAFTGASAVVERFPPRWRDRVLPWVFIAPAVVLLTVYLVYPAVSTVIASFFDQKGAFTLDNWRHPQTRPAFVPVEQLVQIPASVEES